MLSCKDVTYLVAVKRERGLSWRERVGVTMHLAICRGCRRFTRHMQLLRVAMTRSEDVMTQQEDIRLSPGSRQRIREKLDKIDR